MDLLTALGSQIGVRQTGTEAARRSAERIAEAFRELGLEPRFQEFPLLGYDADEPELEIEGERWQAGPCTYAHPTPDAGVKGRVRRVGRFPTALADAEVPIWAIEDDDGRELAQVWASPIGAGGGAIPFLSFYGDLATPPIVFISSADAERLTEMDGVRARLRTTARFVPGRSDRNVLVELPGESGETVVVSAHYDSVWRGPGAVDNASGVEGIRRVAERLVETAHSRSILFVAFAAEEPGVIGSRYFVMDAKFRGDLERIVGNVNLDCIAHGDKLELMVGPEELRERALADVQRLGLDTRYPVAVEGPGRGSDHYWFAQEGVPAISIMYFPYPEYHLPTDTRELVDEQKLADAIDLATSLVEGQLEQPVARPQ